MKIYITFFVKTLLSIILEYEYINRKFNLKIKKIKKEICWENYLSELPEQLQNIKNLLPLSYLNSTV